jgi:uncharacterized protein with HEPN domain
LRARGISRLGLFGSMARGEAGPKSDIDLLIEVDPEAGFGLSDLLDLQEGARQAARASDQFRLRQRDAPLAARLDRGRSDRHLLMAGKTPRLYLEHIREAIALIEPYAGGRQRQDLDREPMLRQAIERNSEIISEASRRLPAAMKTRHPEVAWRDIAAIGNILRHENRDIIWRIVTQDIRPLATAIEALLDQVLQDRKT